MPLAGFETDINRLIDSYALQAHNEQAVCFATFKRLFRLGSFAYLHQAYPGLEHNADYTQLLFAAALDRLDTLSPTAPASSTLWALYSRQQQQAPQQQQDVPPQQLDGQAAAASASQPQPAIAANGRAQAGSTQQQPQQQPLQPNRGDEQQALPPAEQQQQQPASPGLGWFQQEGDQLMLDHLHSPCATPPPQQQSSPAAGAHADPQQQAAGSGSAQLQPNLPAAAPPPAEATPHLLLDLDFEELDLLGPAGLASPRPLPAAGPLLQSHQHQQQQQQQQQQPLLPLQLSAGPAGGFAGGNDAGPDDDSDCFFEDLLAILDEATAPLDAGPEAAAAGGGNPGLLAEQQKLLLPLLQQQQQTGATSGGKAAEVAGTLDQPLIQQQQQEAAFAASLLGLPVPAVHMHQQQQQELPQLQPLVAVPLVVKAAVVFTLFCLHETQLNLPKVAAYIPLRQLQLLAVAAGEFRAAGPAAGGDPLRVLQAMLSRQQLLVGGFKRRSTWAPTPPAWLLPGPRVSAAEAAREAAIRAAAARAAARSSGSGVRTAAVAAAVAAARSLGMTAASAVEPLVHREAVFHIKTALRSLSNFRHLQRLCGDYGNARRAMFEPLLGLQEPPAAAAAAAAAGCAETGCAETGGAAGGAVAAAAAAAAAAAGQPAPGKGRQRQQQGQAVAAESAAATQPAAAPPPPELFESSFGSALQQLAADEAARMLMLLDPSHNPNQVKKTLAQLQKADKAAAAKAAATAAADQPAAGAKGGRKRQRGLAAARAAAAAAAVPASSGGGVRSYVGEVAAAGILGPGDLEELQQLSGRQNEDAGVSGAVRQVLQAQRERQQHTLRVAEGWLSAHDAMMDLADGEDMP